MLLAISLLSLLLLKCQSSADWPRCVHAFQTYFCSWLCSYFTCIYCSSDLGSAYIHRNYISLAYTFAPQVPSRLCYSHLEVWTLCKHKTLSRSFSFESAANSVPVESARLLLSRVSTGHSISLPTNSHTVSPPSTPRLLVAWEWKLAHCVNSAR